jgi:putative flippase GtrA
MFKGLKKIFRPFLKKSFFVYGIVGVVVTVVQVTLLFALRNVTQFNDFVCVTAAYIVALVFHYFLNKRITFLINEKKIFNMMSLRYILVVILSYLIYIFNIFLFNRIIGLEFSISLYITLAINYAVNYLLYQKVVFTNNKLLYQIKRLGKGSNY